MTMTTNLEISLSDKRTFTYGTISCGADTCSGVWTKGTQVFSYDDRLRSDVKIIIQTFSAPLGRNMEG